MLFQLLKLQFWVTLPSRFCQTWGTSQNFHSDMGMTASISSRILIPALLSLCLAWQNREVFLMEQSVCCLRICLPFYATFSWNKVVLTMTYEVPIWLGLQEPPNDILHHVPWCHTGSFVLCCFFYSPSTILLNIPNAVVVSQDIYTCAGSILLLLRVCQHCLLMSTCSVLCVSVPFHSQYMHHPLIWLPCLTPFEHRCSDSRGLI